MLRRLSRHVGAGRSATSRLAPVATLTTASSPTNPTVGDFDPFEYTSGRWLLDDAAQRRARRTDFNFEALCQKAVRSCPGAREILQCDKVEGNLNRAFVFKLDNGASVVAKVPFSVAGPARLVTNSEVATLAHIRGTTTVPVPKVLDWSDDPGNPAATEYIVMEHVPGVQLPTIWQEMSDNQQFKCIINLVALVKQLHDLEFPAYGSIYFSDSPISKSHRVELGKGFCVGPSCNTRYWPSLGEPRFYDRTPPNRGPWTNFDDFTRGLLDAGVARVPPETPSPRLPYRGTVDEHMALIAHARRILEVLAQDKRIRDVSAPSLFHPDLHKRNIFVDPADPTKITALIDWQSASLDPSFFSAGNTPDLCEYPETFEDILDDLGAQKSEEPSVEAVIEKELKSRPMVWELFLTLWAPRVHKARVMDTHLVHPFRYSYSSWRDSSTAFRDGLVGLSNRWDELGLPGRCTYQPSQEELDVHVRHMDDLEAADKLKDFFVRAINCSGDGWVPADVYESTKEASDEALEHWLSVVDEDMDEEKARQLWPFDQ